VRPYCYELFFILRSGEGDGETGSTGSSLSLVPLSALLIGYMY